MTGHAPESKDADLYAVPVAARWLLYSPRNMTAAVVNRPAVASIARHIAGHETGLPKELLHLWRHLVREPDPSTSTNGAHDKLVIMPTRACNMHCIYCDFAAATAPTATLHPRLACRMIDYFETQLRARGHRTLHLHLFGGEPLVARQCTDTIVHYARSVCARTGSIPWIELTTNGFFNPGLAPFIGDYMDSVVVSLDGTESLHNYNRRRHDGGGTYAEVAANIKRLAGFPVAVCLRMCVTNRSVREMADSAAYFCGEFEFDVLSFEMLAENECGRGAGLNAPDPYAFAEGILKTEALASKHGVRVVHGPSELIGPRVSSCPLGQGTLMLTPEGRITACYLNPERWKARGLDLNLGHVDASMGVSIDQHKLDEVAALVRSKPRCRRCFCRHTCAGGCHIDQTPPGCSPDYDARCRAIRVITANRILQTLGYSENKDLVHHIAVMETLANHPDDRLASWHEHPQKERC